DSLNDAVEDADMIVVSVPSVAIASTAELLKNAEFSDETIIVSTVKGFETVSLNRPTQLLEKELNGRGRIGVLSGPSHAEEVVNQIPTAIVAASTDTETRCLVQRKFSNIYFRVYTSSDLIGVELGGALKNVIAIASGIVAGSGLGDNTRAALIARGNTEITRLGIAMGASSDTFSGLSGIGDLIVTCFSEHSRNFRFGKYLGSGHTFEDALAKMKTTVEGINTAKCVDRLAEKYQVSMPLCNKISEMLFDNKSVSDAWKELMLRPLKSEDDGKCLEEEFE
ncbi:MAG: NAD(P)-dependent glycerol-3-phosphate dehydrogenase, partial [Elusimicrobia bacterium]|nr:NAD(P)-dependent glycerol-3-phosphate dehydrogenase [Elusimicrobiota bacterium]